MNKKVLSFHINFNTSLLQNLKIFKNFGLISKFSIEKINNKYYFLIQINIIKNTFFIKNIKLLSTPSKPFFITIKALNLLNKKSGNSVYVISSGMGNITHHNALKLNKSGKLLYVFY